VSTPTLPPTGKPIESTVDPTDPTSRSEVCLAVSDRPLEPAVIFVTKYCGREVGERSVGQHPDIADDVAAVLRDAAATCLQGNPNKAATKRRPREGATMHQPLPDQLPASEPARVDAAGGKISV